jgi:HEAT repeat protein
MQDEDLLKLIADHMEGGFLENIVDMFKHDRTLYRFLPELMADERGRVRLGMVALVETLVGEHQDDISSHVPGVAEALLKHEEPTVRGDAVYLLGVIGGKEALRHLQEAVHSEKVEPIRQVMWETIVELTENRP